VAVGSVPGYWQRQLLGRKGRSRLYGAKQCWTVSAAVKAIEGLGRLSFHLPWPDNALSKQTGMAWRNHWCAFSLLHDSQPRVAKHHGLHRLPRPMARGALAPPLPPAFFSAAADAACLACNWGDEVQYAACCQEPVVIQMQQALRALAPRLAHPRITRFKD
jgi:hypothetical protein